MNASGSDGDDGRIARRAVLAAAAGGLAGCTEVLPDEAEAKQLELGTGRGVEVVETASVDPDLDVGYEVAVTRSEIARSGPAILDVTFTNEADAERAVEFGPRPPFSTVSPRESDQYLLVGGRAFSHPQACYEPNLDPSQPYELPDETTTVALGPGESTAVLLELWGNHRTEACLPPGTYTFETTARLADGPSFSWSFTLEITEIEVDPDA